MVRQNPAMIAVMLATGLAAGASVGAAEAQPLQMVSDGAGGAWVLDEASGAVSWCGLVMPSGAKLIDVFGADSQVREAPPRTARPECEQVRGPTVTGAGPIDLAALLAALLAGAGAYGEPVYAPWWGDDFGWRRHPGDVGGGRDRDAVGAAYPRR